MTATVTFSAKTVAADASLMLGRNVRASVIRGLARGDNGAPLVKRLADDGYTAHAYSAAERTTLLAALAAREGRRSPTGKAPAIPAIGAAARAAGRHPSKGATGRGKTDAALGKRKVSVKPGAGMAATVKPEATPTA